MLLDLKVIASTSKGNGYLFKKIGTLIDLGVPYNMIKDYAKEIKYVFISHEHQDHINPDTSDALHKANPKIKFFANKSVIEKYGLDYYTAINKYSVIKLGVSTQINVVDLYHIGTRKEQVDNQGFLIQYQNYTHFHFTDTHTLEGIIIPKCDSISGEVSYNKELTLQNKENIVGYDYTDRGMLSHLEDFKTYAFLDIYLKEGGLFYPCHMSERNINKHMIKFMTNHNVVEWWIKQEEEQETNLFEDVIL